MLVFYYTQNNTCNIKGYNLTLPPLSFHYHKMFTVYEFKKKNLLDMIKINQTRILIDQCCQLMHGWRKK